MWGLGPLLDISSGAFYIGAAYVGYMDITFPHGCVLCIDINIDIWDRDLSKESFSQTMKNALPVIF